ncbi:hypothetical protein ACFL1R_06585 [Candidatus Latescibacterota bacterium]
MKFIFIRSFFVVIALGYLTIHFAGCSRKSATYDELEETGRIESIARKDYSRFFKQIKRLGNFSDESPDSVFVSKTSALTDLVIEDIRPFPSTFQSRIALDALSYAASDLTESPGSSHDEVYLFWRNALLFPIFVKGREYIKSQNTNESTHVQLVKALQRGIGSMATDDMLLEIIPIIGSAPSEKIMGVCEADSLVLKKIYELIVYTRSLQKMGPPLWMTTGAWFVAVDMEGWPLSFFCLSPQMVNNSLYLTFRDYYQGEVYTAVYNDPPPRDTSQMDAWLTRASEALNSIVYNDTFSEKVRMSGLPTYDTHFFYNDFLLGAKTDSLKKKFSVIFKRDRIWESTLQFTGVDSMEIVFTEDEMFTPTESILHLSATRYHGASMSGGGFIPSRRREGTAYLMPLGKRDITMMREIQEILMPEIKVNTE